jgi:hypothetical protein
MAARIGTMVESKLAATDEQTNNALMLEIHFLEVIKNDLLYCPW